MNNKAFRTQRGIKNCQIADILDDVDSQITKICTLDLRTDKLGESLNSIILISTFSCVCAVSKLITVITMK